MNLIKALLLLLFVGVIGAAAFVYFGIFDAAADVPHSPLVYQLMEVTRQRSIAVRAKDIPVPLLDDPKLIADGAEHYSAMCTGCHLAPGMTDSEIRPGLYPQPPNLSQRIDATPAEMFWAIKHGIKMSAMPAWGTSHDNQAIWGIVAFLQKMPDMTPEQYKALTQSSGGGEEGHHHHHHDDAAADAGEGEAGHHHHDGGDAADSSTAEPAHHHDHSEAAADDAHDHASAAPEVPISLDGLKAKAVPDAEQVALAFHRALQKGDRDAVIELLSGEATVNEAGHTQSLDEYASGHLGEDIAFLKTAQVKPISLASMPIGETAMVGSESEIRTTADGQPKVQRSREMLTLKRETGAWKIVAVRWQSVQSETTDHTSHADEHK
jgi:ketosteroid isomerase-like protein/cytochrome c553